jgi:hypothetical protein
MPHRRENESDRKLDMVLVLGLFALLLLTSPLLAWWAAPDNPWYMPYLIWTLLIALGAWLQSRRGRGDV